MIKSRVVSEDKETFLGAIGSVISSLRNERNMTLKDVADATNKSVSYLSEIESGKKSPDVSVYKDIADALNVDLYRIFFKVSEEMHLKPQQRKTMGEYAPIFKQLEKLADQLNKDSEDEDEGFDGESSIISRTHAKFSQHV